MKPTRRELLGTLVAGAAVPACTGGDWEPRAPRVGDPDSDWTAEAPDVSAFPLAAMAGDPLPDGLLLWTKYTGTSDLELRWATWDGQAWSATSSESVAVADGGFVHHELTGIAADTPVAFQFVDGDGAASASALGRTAPARGTGGTLRILATACSKWRDEGHPVFPNAIARGAYDVVLWAGDTVYTYDQTLEEYRDRWALYFASADFQTAYTAGANVFSWDDHEVTNNWEGDDVPPNQLANGVAAFYEHTPTRRGPDGQLWRSFRMGDIVEIIVLDCRGERDYDAGIYLSPQQMEWAKATIASSPCRWKMVVNSVPIANMPELFDAVEEVQRDRWEAYPDQRQELLDAVADVPGVFFVSGDFHMPFVARVEPDGPSRHVWDIVCGAAGSNGNPIGALMHRQPDLYADQFPWSETPRTATLIDLDDAGFMRVRFVGEDDLTYFDGLWDDQGRLLEHTVVEVPT